MPRFILGLVLVTGALGLGACNDTPTNPARSVYLEPTSPENVVQNLALAYRRQEIEPYAKLLAPEFVFKFQPVDVAELLIDQWGKDQDVAGTGGLFGTPMVGDIRINLPHDPAAAPTEPGFDPGVMKIRVRPTQLEVDQIAGNNAGITYQVDGDIQDMFFRPGKADLGENPDHWFLFEWRDLPNPTAASRPGARSATGPAVAPGATWGHIKTLFSEAQ